MLDPISEQQGVNWTITKRIATYWCAVYSIPNNARQAAAVIKRIGANRGDGIRDGYARQGSAITKRKAVNEGYRIRDSHARQASAIKERHVADGGDRVAESYTCQAIAVTERTFADEGDRVGDDYARQAMAVIERPRTNSSDGIRDEYARQAAAVMERIGSNRCDGIGSTAIGYGAGNSNGSAVITGVSTVWITLIGHSSIGATFVVIDTIDLKHWKLLAAKEPATRELI